MKIFFHPTKHPSLYFYFISHVNHSNKQHNHKWSLCLIFRPLYFVKVDIKNCFDSIQKEKLPALIEKLLKPVSLVVTLTKSIVIRFKTRPILLYTRGVQFNLLHFDCAVNTAHYVKPIKSLLQYSAWALIFLLLLVRFNVQ